MARQFETESLRKVIVCPFNMSHGLYASLKLTAILEAWAKTFARGLDSGHARGTC